jgi:hypothetical protein
MAQKNIVNSLLFLSILVAILISLEETLIYGVKAVRENQIGKVNIIAAHEFDPQIAVFGSSVSEVGVNPNILSKITAKSCYNFSLNGTSFYQYRGLIDEFLSYSRKSNIIILSEAYFSFSKNEAINSPDIYLAHIDNATISDPLFEIDNDLIWKIKYVPFYRFIAASHIYYKHAAHGLLNNLKSIKDNDSFNGFSPVYRGWEIDADEAIKKTGKFKIIINPYVLSLYIAQVRCIQKHGIKVVIILTPIYRKALEMATDFNPLYDALLRIKYETNATILDFSSCELTKDKSVFYNSNHLNYKGAVKFSQILGDSLNKLFLLNIK